MTCREWLWLMFSNDNIARSMLMQSANQKKVQLQFAKKSRTTETVEYPEIKEIPNGFSHHERHITCIGGGRHHTSEK
jgi:hypothetical protein